MVAMLICSAPWLPIFVAPNSLKDEEILSNGIVSLVWSMTICLVFELTGCAQSRGSHVGTLGPHELGSVTAAEQSVAARAAHSPTGGIVMENKICPVTGEPNGSMGDSIPVTVDGQTLYVCCRGNYEKNSLSLIGSVAMGTGVMIGAGIFALTGQVAEQSGGLFPLAFLAAAIVAGFSAYSYVKMATLNRPSNRIRLCQGWRLSMLGLE